VDSQPKRLTDEPKRVENDAKWLVFDANWMDNDNARLGGESFWVFFGWINLKKVLGKLRLSSNILRISATEYSLYWRNAYIWVLTCSSKTNNH